MTECECLSKNEQLILASYIIEQLSAEDKTVRDPIHGDILWNHLETCVIDTEDFQRLRRIKQLGTAHFVFPGAEHSRFQHSLGTLHMAQVLLRNITNNRFSDYQAFGKTHTQDMAFRLIVRLAALLHDVHEFPLSHTLEKEGNVFQKQWKDKALNIKMLGRDSEIFKAVCDYILKLLGSEDEKKVLEGQIQLSAEDKETFAKRLARTIITFTYRVISSRDDKASEITQELFGDKDIIEDLVDEKFLVSGSQIILDTVCADLLDYLPRDFYFCGIKKTYDERFLKYATVSDCSDTKKKIPSPVFAYRLIGKRGEIKFSVLSSLFDALELRYTLAELVHTHRTKNAFSTMAIEAFNYYYQFLNDATKLAFIDRIMHMGDDELLSYVREQNPVSEHILNYYFKRRPYHECILCSYRTVEEDPDLAKALSDHINDPNERLYLERILVKFLNSSLTASKKLEDGDCLMYMMPNPNRLYKELETNVIYLDEKQKPKVGTLLSLTEERYYSPTPRTMRTIIERTRAQRELLIKKYENLWHTSLFISPDVDYSSIQPIAAELIEQIFCYGLLCDFKVEAPKTLHSGELHEKLLTLTKEHRGFTTFKEIFEAYEKTFKT